MATTDPVTLPQQSCFSNIGLPLIRQSLVSKGENVLSSKSTSTDLDVKEPPRSIAIDPSSFGSFTDKAEANISEPEPETKKVGQFKGVHVYKRYTRRQTVVIIFFIPLAVLITFLPLQFEANVTSYDTVSTFVGFLVHSDVEANRSEIVPFLFISYYGLMRHCYNLNFYFTNNEVAHSKGSDKPACVYFKESGLSSAYMVMKFTDSFAALATVFFAICLLKRQLFGLTAFFNVAFGAFAIHITMLVFHFIHKKNHDYEADAFEEFQLELRNLTFGAVQGSSVHTPHSFIAIWLMHSYWIVTFVVLVNKIWTSMTRKPLGPYDESAALDTKASDEYLRMLPFDLEMLQCPIKMDSLSDDAFNKFLGRSKVETDLDFDKQLSDMVGIKEEVPIFLTNLPEVDISVDGEDEGSTIN